MQFGLRASSFHLAFDELPPQGLCLFAAPQHEELRAQRERLQRVIGGTRLRMLGERCNPLQRLVAAEVHFRQLLGLWRLDFACGVAREVLQAELQGVFNALDAWRACYVALPRSRRAGAGLPGDLADARHYRDLLQLSALLRLFGLSAALDHLQIWLEDAPLDALMAALLHGQRPRTDDAAPPAEYALLLRALQAPRISVAAAWVGAYRMADELGRAPAEVCAGRAGCAFEALALLQLPIWPSDPHTSSKRRPFRPGAIAGRRMAAGMAAALLVQEQVQAQAMPPQPAEATERGLASWYGPGFQDRPTANGERYDMFELSAAHKSLPLPSFVHVRNLRNGRQVVVVVNDRGPFVDGRVIDLSYAAAQRLGMVEDGVVEVELRPLSAEQLKALAAADVPAPARETAEARLPAFAGGLAALASEAPAAAQIAEARTLQASPRAVAELRAEPLAVAATDIAPLPSLPARLLVALSSPRTEPVRPLQIADAANGLPSFAGGLLALQSPEAPVEPAQPPARPEPPRMMQAALLWDARASDPWPRAQLDRPAQAPELGPPALPPDMLAGLQAPQPQALPDEPSAALPEFAGGLRKLAAREVPRAQRRVASARPRIKTEATSRRNGLSALSNALAPSRQVAKPLAKPQPALQARTSPPPPLAPGLMTRAVALAQRGWQDLAGWLGLRSTDNRKA